MENKKICLQIVTALIAGSLVIVFCASCFRQAQQAESSEQKMFPVWDGRTDIFSPYDSEIICLVQFEPMQLEWEGQKVELQEPSWNYVIKTYSENDDIQQLFEYLHNPQIRIAQEIKAEQCLLVLFVSRKLNRQFAIRIPFRLDEDGYAVTPRGEDRRLYQILKQGLDEWQIAKEAEYEIYRAVGHYLVYESQQRHQMSREGFKSFLRDRNENPQDIIDTLQTYYGDPNFIENRFIQKSLSPDSRDGRPADSNTPPLGYWL